MLNSKILSIACITPPYHASVDNMTEYAQTWVAEQDPDFQAKVNKIFRKAAVESRYTVVPLSQIFSPMTLDAKNAIYRDTIVDLAQTALAQALEKAQLSPTDIDCLITTSCTGHMSPSLDAFLVNRLHMKSSIQRLPVMEMGCIGGVVGLIYAENYLRAYPGRYVALICAELTSITFQRDDFSWANIVSAAIFGDGIACAILGPSVELRPQMMGSRLYHFPDTTDLLGFNLSSTGFQMVLDERLPEQIRQHFSAFTQPLLEEFNLTLQDIQYCMAHPGGKKILQNLELILRRFGINLDDSREILRQYGNVSSATVLFILERFLNKPIVTDEKALILGFGPGLTAGTILLEWK